MTATCVLFIQGGGKGAHSEDASLANSLKQALGPKYETITVVGDNVAGNDLPFHQVFPYMATPHSGANNSKDSTTP